MGINIASYIDHTLLKPSTNEQIAQLCNEAMKYKFASVCVLPDYVAFCAKHLLGSKVKVCTVVGFPLGENTTATKVFETVNAIENGATEIDMVINLSWVLRSEWQLIETEIASVVHAAKDKAIVKVILEICLLDEQQIINVTKCVRIANAAFAKTSTGFSKSGATIQAVALMKATLEGSNVQVKASGGIKDYQTAINMINAGATRLGTSNGVAIMEGEQAANNY